MRRILTSLVGALALLAATITPSHAITGNYVADDEHPFVGLVAFYDENGEFAGRCSGSLLSPSVFLTAGHCTDGAATAVVWFQQDAGADYDPETGAPASSGYPDGCAQGTLGIMCATSDELYNWGFDDFATFPDTKDLGLVILDQPITVSEYGQLAEAGTLDPLATARGGQDLTVTASGYGLSYSSPVAVESFRSRLMAEGKIVNLESQNNAGFNVQTVGKGKGRGGTCSGDSGGPIFLGGYESNLIVAVTSFGLNSYCRGVDFAYRVDTVAAQQWILDTVAASSAADEAELIVIV
ncbi:trypsin-like serine protease [Tessaracoccus sp. OS52]|uniref:trypsin-like serine protease n=1 Tax=Tessaracoccus sp. OS52 TaxID=2886691 RepID=UPI001D12C59C|nr:trypsin-like serine protease [Tessaracoccus sp. OS52]MCC2592767.1 trypsin-like serine protease [Tessaracoccus sp. OS52]